MCGIAGWFGPPQPGVAAAAAKLIAHRGPDDEGFFECDDATLAARRLSIIDLPLGRQPQSNRDGSVNVVFNGEIYNHALLRDELTRKGHVFRTRSDTEVIAHAYEAWGDACVERFRGMFAFALWDAKKRQGLLARDRFGKKPLYLWEHGGRFSFASEIKAFLALPGFSPTPDPIALQQYLAFQYVPGPRTMFAGVSKLPPATLLVWRRGSGGTSKRYWALPDGSDESDAHSAKPAELRERFGDAVKSRLVSDVPLGVLLSGGVDSASVVAAMAALGHRPLHTFTVGFEPHAAYDETEWARATAKRFGTEHHEVLTLPRATELLPRLIWHLDEPVADEACLPTYLVTRLAAERVKVVLTGEGSDELLAGYPRYLLSRLAGRVAGVPGAAALASLVPGDGRLSRGLRRLLTASRDPFERNLEWVANFGASGLTELLGDAGRGAWASATEAYAAAGRDEVRRDGVSEIQRADIGTWLVDDVLMKVDKMAMANSVEARAPFLDHEMAEWIWRLPRRAKLDGFVTKALLKEAMRPEVGTDAAYRAKQAFRLPAREWFRRDLRALTEEALLVPRARRGFWDASAVRRLADDHFEGRADHHQRLWNLIVLELWSRLFLDGEWKYYASPPILGFPPPGGGRAREGVSAREELRATAGGTRPLSPTLPPKGGGGTRASAVVWDFPPGIGGIQNYTASLFRAASGLELSVIAPELAGDAEWDASAPFPVTRFPPSRLPGRLGKYMTLLRLQRALSASRGVILAGHVLTGVVARRESKRSGRPYVVFTYALEIGAPGYPRLIRRVLREAAAVVSIADFTTEIVLRAGVDRSRIVKITPGFDPAPFDSIERRTGSATVDGLLWEKSRGKRIVLTVARLDPLNRYKGVDVSIRAFAEVARKHPDALYAVAGDGPDRDYLKRLAFESGVADRVRFIGNVSDAALPGLYSLCDLFLMPSREEKTSRGVAAEGFGIVFLEANAAGKPVVGGNSGGVPDAVEDGVSGLLVAPESAEAVAGAVSRLLSDRSLASRLGAQGRERVRRDFTWPSRGRALEDLVRGLST